MNARKPARTQRRTDSRQPAVKPVFIPANQLHRVRDPRDPRIRVVFSSRIVPASQLAKLQSKIYSKT